MFNVIEYTMKTKEVIQCLLINRKCVLKGNRVPPVDSNRPSSSLQLAMDILFLLHNLLHASR